MNEAVQSQIEIYIGRLDVLIGRGADVRAALEREPASPNAVVASRLWQQDCGIIVNELSGGSKAHWLARAFSEAFLVRGSAGVVVEGVPAVDIANRLLDVLQQARASLNQEDASARIASSESEPPSPHRFDFVRNAGLRPVLEQAYNDGRRAFDRGDYKLALVTYCGILEAIITDALENARVNDLPPDAPNAKIADWSFDQRINAAESMGTIRGGCARLPAIARSYRDLIEANGQQKSDATISERDARVTGQVLHVVMRDLNPGR
jgi:hypothetical protein